ncbi:hypothetical protein M5K25_019791 [Dendrobium thyrsiflorum]|uniref:Secreted protein n=1 Tax=Dendrobium thyrsiflorum TaxID=117978 RepID=A0ABD0UMQ8_DENTH
MPKFRAEFAYAILCATQNSKIFARLALLRAERRGRGVSLMSSPPGPSGPMLAFLESKAVHDRSVHSLRLLTLVLSVLRLLRGVTFIFS